MKKFWICILAVFTVCLFISQVGSGQIQARKKTSLDESWKFHFGNAANPNRDFNFGIVPVFVKTGGTAQTAIDARFDDRDWRSLDLPHDWAVELPFTNSPDFNVMSHGYKPVGGIFPETSIGWYRHHFKIARADSGGRFQVRFDGIFRDAKIWLNGFYLGNNQSGYVGASYDVTDYVKFNSDNVLAVRVDATQYEGWFYEGAGIYRHVWLNQYNNLHIPDGGVFVSAEVQGKNATISVETTVENLNLARVSGTVYSYITDRNGKRMAQSKEQPLMLDVNGRGTVRQKIAMTDPRLWSLEDPYLYKVVSVVKSGNQIADIRQDRFGIRTVRFDATNGFF